MQYWQNEILQCWDNISRQHWLRYSLDVANTSNIGSILHFYYDCFALKKYNAWFNCLKKRTYNNVIVNLS